MMEQFTIFMQDTTKTVLIPAVTVIGGAVLLLIKKYVKNYLEKLQAKAEIEQLAKMNELRNSLLEQIETIVRSFVGSNMQLAKEMKNASADGRLTDEQADELRATAKTLIWASLPTSLVEEDGVLMKMIGGKDKLEIIIKGFMEKCVYEYNSSNKDNR